MTTCACSWKISMCMLRKCHVHRHAIGVSVGWDGQLYDCDFNQMLEIPLNFKPRTIWDINDLKDAPKGIAFDNHCYGCTAGAGSSCGGSLES